MKVTATAPSPTKIDRASKLRVRTEITSDVPLEASRSPHFAFTDYDARPVSWQVGRWVTSGPGWIAEGPMLGQATQLAPGVIQVWGKISSADGQEWVGAIGFVHVT